jgi:hypothetical protein
MRNEIMKAKEATKKVNEERIEFSETEIEEAKSKWCE